MPLTAVLFDLDNTIYPRSSGVQQALDERMNAYVQRVSGEPPAAVRALRSSWFARWGTTLAGLQREYAIDVEDYLRDIHDIRLDALLAPDAELDRLLERLTVRRAIFTNSPAEHAGRVLRTLGVAQHFPLIFDIRFLEFRPKPDLTAYTRVIEALDIDPATTLLIEDSPQNLPPARSLGLRTILVDERNAHPANGDADHVVTDVHTALRLILERY